MLWFPAFLMLAFYGLGVCTIGGMLTNGISGALAMAAAFFEVIVGTVIIRAIYFRYQ